MELSRAFFLLDWPLPVTGINVRWNPVTMPEDKRVTIVITSNHLRKWWLVNVRGYRVTQSIVTPELTLLGRVGYRHEWKLVQQGASENSGF